MRALLCALFLLAAGVPTLTGHAQTPADASGRAPRFFLASIPSMPPRPLDIARTPILRRRIALNLRNATLADGLTAVSRQAGLQLMYSKDLVPLEQRVTLEAKAITVAAALTELLLDANADVVFSGTGQAVLVRRSAQSVAWPGGTIIGYVRDSASKHGVSGVDILLEGTRWRAMTDSAGRYRFAAVDSGTYTLTARRIGYAKQSQRVTVGAEREDTVDIVLRPLPAKLEDLVTTATGNQRRRDLGNAITTIRADSVLQTAPIKSLTDLLENRVPGLTTQHTSGAPGDPARLRLRGLGSVLHANDPVVIVDAVRVYAAQSDARSGNLTNLTGPITRDCSGCVNGRVVHAPATPAPSPLDQIDPNIIEKIEVFKGPSAATMYGADAANGVIVITTKRGKPGPTRWSANVSHGREATPGRYPVGYYRWGRDLLTGATRFCTLIDVKCLQDSLVQFQALNDQNLTVLGRGRRTGVSLTASGGTQALTYSLTGSYSDDIGLLTLPAFEADRFQTLFNRAAPEWMRRPHRYKYWSVASAVTARLGPSADVTLSTKLSRSEQDRTSLESQVSPLSATYVDTVNGVYYRPAFTEGNYALDATGDILSDYYIRQAASTITFTTGLNASWRPRTWFTASGQAGLDVMPRDDELLLPAGLLAATDSGAFTRGTGRSLQGTFSFQGTVSKPLGLGFTFETSAGANVATQNTADLVSTASGLVPGTSSLSGARRISAVENRVTTSVFGWYVEPRISGKRLSFSTGVRLDGGSAYGARLTGNGTHPFHWHDIVNPAQLFGLRSLARNLLALPKLNGSWVISEEPWFPFSGLFSSLRLRGAYGQAQVQPSATDRLRLYTSSLNQFGQLLTLTSVGNTHLRPERSTEFEGGFDADLLDSRMSLELTGYRKMQVDALMSVALPGSVNGGGSVFQNIGNIRNTGVELSLGLTPVRSSGVTWTTKLELSHNHNELVELGRGVLRNPAAGLVAGYPVGSRWARRIRGYADQNGDGVLQPQEIQVGDSLFYIGRLYPNYTTALFTNLALFGGVVVVNAGFSYQAGATQVDSTARKNWVLARALVDPSAPMSDQAAVLASTRSAQPTDYGLIQTVSTFRFNSFSLNYQPPVRIARLVRAERLWIAVQGENLALHSSYQGKDPDVNAWSPGEGIADTGQLPLPRRWQLAVRLEY